MLAITGVIFISGCIKQEQEKQTGDQLPKEPSIREGIPGGIKEAKPKLEGLTKTESVIEMECVEGIVSYKESSLWDQEVEGEKFKEELIKEFKEGIKGFGVEAKSCFVELKGNSAVLSCDVHGSLQHTWYDFDWFLRPRGLDFLDSNFERKEKELSWKGKVTGVRTTIRIKFPHAISNCHEHVWKK